MSATHEVGDSEFEKWWTQFKSDEFRLAESGWTEKDIAKLAWRAAIKADRQRRVEPVELCDCERGHNGIGIAVRECDCTGNNPHPAALRGIPMPLFRKKPVVIEATQWFRNGDHPNDFSDRDNADGRMTREGMVVRYFRHPDVSGDSACKHCGNAMHDHGWIDTLEGGHIVCPGDWIITGVKGEHYPCKPDIFAQTYELVSETECRIEGDVE